MSRVSQWVALGQTCPWSYVQYPACGPRSGSAEGHSLVLAEILSTAHVPRPDHRRGRAAAPASVQGYNLTLSSEHLTESQIGTRGFPPADWGSGKTAWRPLRMGGEEAFGRAWAYIGYFHLCVDDCRHLQIWGPHALPGQRTQVFDGVFDSVYMSIDSSSRTDTSPPRLTGLVKI